MATSSTSLGVALPFAAVGIVALVGRNRRMALVALDLGRDCGRGGRASRAATSPTTGRLSAFLAVAAAVGCAVLVDALAARAAGDGGPAFPATAAGTVVAGRAPGRGGDGVPSTGAVRRRGQRPSNDARYEDAFVNGDYSANRNEEVSRWLRGHTEPDGRRCCCGATSPASTSSATGPPASRFGYTLPLVGEGGDGGGLVDEYRDELVDDGAPAPADRVRDHRERRQPGAAALTSREYLEAFPELDRFIGSALRRGRRESATRPPCCDVGRRDRRRAPDRPGPVPGGS